MSGSGLINDAFSFIGMMPLWQVLVMYWFALVFEVPRYAMAFPAIVAMYVQDRKRKGPPMLPPRLGKVSILIAGHNEADAIERGVKSSQWRMQRQAAATCSILTSCATNTHPMNLPIC